jgi:hypothetical protein
METKWLKQDCYEAGTSHKRKVGDIMVRYASMWENKLICKMWKQRKELLGVTVFFPSCSLELYIVLRQFSYMLDLTSVDSITVPHCTLDTMSYSLTEDLALHFTHYPTCDHNVTLPITPTTTTTTSSWLNITRYQWSHWRPNCDRKWWSWNNNDAVHQDVKVSWSLFTSPYICDQDKEKSCQQQAVSRGGDELYKS